MPGHTWVSTLLNVSVFWFLFLALSLRAHIRDLNPSESFLLSRLNLVWNASKTKARNKTPKQEQTLFLLLCIYYVDGFHKGISDIYSIVTTPILFFPLPPPSPNHLLFLKPPFHRLTLLYTFV